MVAELARRGARTAALLGAALLPGEAAASQVVLPKLVEGVELGGSEVVREGVIGESGVTYLGRYSWPSALSRGWFPVELELRNEGTEGALVQLVATQPFGEEDRVTRRIGLAPGERVALELLLRSRAIGMDEYVVDLSVGGDEARLAGLGPGEAAGTGSVVLHASAELPPPGSQERWSALWGSGESPSHGLHGHVHTAVMGQVAARTFAQLSTNWQAYTSLDTVVLDLSGGRPEPGVLDALLAWSRTGGKLCLFGVPLDRLSADPGLAPLLEERFVLTGHEELEQRGLRAFALGLGVVVARQGDSDPQEFMEPAGGERPLALLVDRLPLAGSWIREPQGRLTRTRLLQDTLAEFEGLPLRGLMVMLVLFALVLGPVNFYWVRRRGKPLLLLLTVPGLSVAMSVGLLLYGILSQGLEIKAHTRSLSVLDQRLQRAVAAEVRHLFAGSSPGAGLRPEPGTAVVPEPRFWSGSWRSESFFTVDLTDGRLLGGDYLPVRQPVGQLVLSERPSRLRLDLGGDGQAIEVTNGLGARIEDLVLRTADGAYHRLGAPLGEGEVGPLTPVSGIEGAGDLRHELVWFGGRPNAASLAPGSYLARLDGHALRDDLGIEVVELTGSHLLLGVLDGREEAR